MHTYAEEKAVIDQILYFNGRNMHLAKEYGVRRSIVESYVGNPRIIDEMLADGKLWIKAGLKGSVIDPMVGIA